MIRVEEVEKRLKERIINETAPDLPVHVTRSRDEIERELILNSLLTLHNDVKEILNILKGTYERSVSRWNNVIEVTDSQVEPRDLESMEKEAIMKALVASGGNRRKAAKQLGISERTLYRRIKQYNLK